jgi:hypothetical protein
MRLPNAASAVLDIRKTANYCLDSDHPLGRHKARVFRAALGLTIADAGWLRQEILRRAQDAEAVEFEADQFGTRFGVDLVLRRHGREAVVRTAWIVAGSTEAPRFVTCWIP